MKYAKSPLVAICCCAVTLYGCQEAFEKPLDQKKISLSAPANNLQSDSADQVFYWQPLDSGTNYELQIVTPGFDSIAGLLVDTITPRNILRLVLGPAQYQWRVRGFNASSSSAYTAPWTLTIF
jgi:hypothetical protein